MINNPLLCIPYGIWTLMKAGFMNKWDEFEPMDPETEGAERVYWAIPCSFCALRGAFSGIFFGLGLAQLALSNKKAGVVQ